MRVVSGLLLALTISAVTRLGWLGLVEFKNDESWALQVASSIANGQAHPLVGIGSSLGVPNAPFFVYLMAIPEVFARDPAVATAFIGLLGVGAVGITYFIGRWLSGDVAGVSAALLYAVSPWGIIYSRKVWEQDALPFFVGLGMFALFFALDEGRRRLIAPGLVLLALAVQLHPTAITLAIPAAILVAGCLVIDRKVPVRTLRWLAVGSVASACLEVPYVIWQFRHGWPLLDVARHLSTDPARSDLTALYLAADIVAGNGYRTLAIVDDSWGPARWIELLLLLAGLVVLTFQASRLAPRQNRFVAAAVVAWLGVPILAQIRHSVPVFPHYFIVLLPAAFVTMGVGTSAIWNLSKRERLIPRSINPIGAWGKVVVLVALASTVGLGVLSFVEYRSALATGAVRPEFGIPLEKQKALLAEAERVADGGPVYVGSHGDLAPSLTYLADGGVRAFDDRIGLLFLLGARPIVIVETDPTTTAEAFLRRVTAGPTETMALGRNDTVSLYRLDPGTTLTGSGFRGLAATFDNGVSLTGYRVATDNAERYVVVDLIFRLDRDAPTVVPTAFNHLLDGELRTVSHLDGQAYPALDWHAGESNFSEFVLPWPTGPGPYRLEFGLYDYPSMKRHQVIESSTGLRVDSLDLEADIRPP